MASTVAQPFSAAPRGCCEPPSTSGAGVAASLRLRRGLGALSRTRAPVAGPLSGLGHRHSAGRGLSSCPRAVYGQSWQFTDSWAEEDWEHSLQQLASVPADALKSPAPEPRAPRDTARTPPSPAGKPGIRAVDLSRPPSDSSTLLDQANGFRQPPRGAPSADNRDPACDSPPSDRPPPNPGARSAAPCSVRASSEREPHAGRSQGPGDGSDREPSSNGVEAWSSGSPRFNVHQATQNRRGRAGVYGDLKEVFVILFGVGQSGHEGIYSLRAVNREDGLPQDTIIAFEDQLDAERYACQLEGTFQSFSHVPHVCSIPPEELLNFCMDSGYNCRMEPVGSSLLPPDFNIGTTDWERSLRLRNGEFSVLEQEPDLNRFSFHDVDDLGNGLTELDRIKLQLERLMDV